MATRRLMLPAVALLFFISDLSAATYHTTNFIVEAATDKLAREFAEAAEHYRKEKAEQWLGTSIEGGTTYHLSKGDVVTVPAGTPHWFKEVPSSISYYTVKIIKP